MRRAAWLCLFVFLITFDALAQQPIGPPSVRIPSGQTSMLMRYDLLTYAGREAFEAQLPLNRRGPFTGVMGGDPVRGMLAMDGAVTRIAFVRMRNGAPWRAYVGARGNTPGGRLTGFSYSLSTGAGASSARNVWSFTSAPPANTFQGCFRNRPCPGLTRPDDPANAVLPYPRGLIDRGMGPFIGLNPPIAHAIVAGSSSQQESGQLDLTLAANGEASGTVFGDNVAGHYAHGAGTLGFVRMRAGQPHQIFVATLERDQRISGRVYSLAGGVLEQTWMGPEPLVVGLNSESTGECMTAASTATRIGLIGCNNPIGPEQRWALVYVGSWRLLSVGAGLCVPEAAANTAITLSECNAGSGQVIHVDGAYRTSAGEARIVENLSRRESPGGTSVGDFSLLRFRWFSDRCIGVPPQNTPPGDYAAITRPCEDDYEEKVWWGKRT